MDATFVVLISFVIFLGIAYRLGYRRAIAALDNKIDAIRATLQEAAQAKESALQQLNAEHRRQSEIQEEIDLVVKRAEEQVVLLRQQNLLEVEKIIKTRQKEAEAMIQRFHQEAVEKLKREATTHTLVTFEALINEFSDAQKVALNDDALTQIADQLDRKSSARRTVKSKRVRSKRSANI